MAQAEPGRHRVQRRGRVTRRAAWATGPCRYLGLYGGSRDKVRLADARGEEGPGWACTAQQARIDAKVGPPSSLLMAASQMLRALNSSSF